MKKIILICLLVIYGVSYSQETFTIMQYNLTYYGNTASFADCNNSNNSTTDKNENLKIIIEEIQPDIFGVNELGFELTYVNSIRDDVLNTNGRDYYDKTKMDGYGDIINQLYYNKNKFGLYSEALIDKELDGDWITRGIDVHTLYYKAPDLADTKDTIYLTFFVAHLKAGSSSSNEILRDDATEAVMSYIENTSIKGYKFFMGDLNVYTSDEQAYQNLTNYSNADINFVDPIDRPGNWNSNSSFASIHTQSTRKDDNNGGCFVSGGMDDRFDFILMDNQMEDENSTVKYVTNSYKAFGNDGAAFNEDLRISNNSVVSDTIAQALYDMSDHLPVVMQIEISSTTSIVNELESHISYNFSNPINNQVFVTSSKEKISLSLIDITGKTLKKTFFSNQPKLVVSDIPSGIYLLKIEDKYENSIVKKVVK